MHGDEPPGARFLRGIASKPQLIAAGHRAGRAQAVPGLAPTGLLLAGQGGLQGAALLLRDAADACVRIPVLVATQGRLPRFVTDGWHVLAFSHAGTDETALEVAREAQGLGCAVTAFASAGTLAAEAARNVAQPVGYTPRVALAHAWFGALGFLEGSGVLDDEVPVRAAMAAVREVDAACGPDVPEAANEARRLARLLHERVPHVLATRPFSGVAATFASLLGATAKKVAFAGDLPASGQDVLAGLAGDGNRRHFATLLLSGDGQGAALTRRVATLRQRHAGWGVPCRERRFGATSSFADHVVEQARALQLLDYAAFYVAELRGVDPFPPPGRATPPHPARQATDATEPGTRRPAGAEGTTEPVETGARGRMGLGGTEPLASQPLPGLAGRPDAPALAAPGPRPRRRPSGDPPSLRAVRRALAEGPRTVADLREATGLPRRTVSAALAMLRRRGLIRQQGSLRDTRQTYFWLDDAADAGLPRPPPSPAEAGRAPSAPTPHVPAPGLVGDLPGPPPDK